MRMVWTCYREAQRKVFFAGAAEAAAALNQGTLSIFTPVLLPEGVRPTRSMPARVY